jgi:hypothetical protein
VHGCLIALLLLVPAAEGRIGGRVVDAARGGAPAAGAEVYLQVKLEDRFEVIGHAAADPEGRFLFEGLPLDPDLVYLPGASRDGVVYPGPRVRVSPERPEVGVVLEVTGSTGGPSPLVLRRFEAVLTREPGALRVAETLDIENPTPVTYVGGTARDAEGASAPATLRLHIPPEFERITFAEEFYGRQFAIREEQPETSLPWTPGRRVLRYVYVVPDDGSLRAWSRALDLPCDHTTLTVVGAEAISNLGEGTRTADGARHFTSSAGTLPAGHALRVALERPATAPGFDPRLLTLAALAAAIAGTIVAIARSRRPTPTPAPGVAPAPARPHATAATRPRGTTGAPRCSDR